ncbi:DUF4126 family protein [Mucilaginibacter myungsuensis]|uniref:DUF4126 family protein n=1 Tax=Mucilaginibacter myungsuensis TaxID=649104 RepID=A0A929KWN3_9SPHI|nr:DUF4126 family protein [Mucilaginibacter myungsuensis]MBE9660284.1 DUF4126 family protein [Mucilaginibacter myungsuensis]MDN3600326.1 DUF4126 family protein [Mucilaginibacter myungsuensis]
MKIVITKPHWQVIALGILAGMRSMSAPAVSSRMLNKRPSRRLNHTPLQTLQSPAAANVLTGIAVGELVGDKLPTAPDRIAPVTLVGRCINGAISGAGIYKAAGGKWYTGAVLGGITAIAATYGSFYLRKAIVKQAHLIDPVVGLIEDTIVLGAGVALVETA